ncbi:MAG: thiamine pyrophosphate-binding protein, partial [Candidatus Eremiobacteraeota bacterium]|nr:thiamine pyrophosphate-binding protein [Candidatus Eremiobacteraeota bacterium]
EVQRLGDLPRAIHRAAKTALAPPTGPVFLSLPADVLNAEGDLALGAPTRVATGLRGDPAAVAQAAEMLAHAERPVILAGDAVAQSGAHRELVALAEALGAPVYAEFIPSRASFPATHPLFRGAMLRLAPHVRAVLDKHDVALSIGADLFALSLPSDVDPVPADLAIVHLDSDPWELGKNYPARAAIFGDPKATLPDLLAALEERLNDRRRAELRARRVDVEAAIAGERVQLKEKARAAASHNPIHPLALIDTIAELLPHDAVVVDETISSGAGLRSLVASDDPQSFFGLRGGGIGWGLPAAIGVKLALPSRPVVALVGDGSALYTCQALWTAAHERVPIVCVIFNNAEYRILKQRLDFLHGSPADGKRSYVGMDLVDPPVDFVSLSRGFGVSAVRVTTLEAVRDAFASALAANEPHLIDVAIGRS